MDEKLKNRIADLLEEAYNLIPGTTDLSMDDEDPTALDELANHLSEARDILAHL